MPLTVSEKLYRQRTTMTMVAQGSGGMLCCHGGYTDDKLLVWVNPYFMVLPPPSPSLLTDWIQPGALFTVVFGLAAFFWKEMKDLRAEMKDLRAEQKADLKDLKLELKAEFKADVAQLRADNAELRADNRVLSDKLDRLLENSLTAKP